MVATVAVGTGCTGNGGSGEELSIEIDGPVSPAWTNGILTFQIDVHGGRPERVELRRDGVLLTELSYPWLWAWDTAGADEGTYSVVAVAIDGEKTVQSNPVAVNVDRTAPQVLERSPLPGAEDVDVFGTITVVLDEAVDERTVDMARVEFAAGSPVNGATLSADGKTLTLPVSADLLPTPNVATVDLSDVHDLAGNPVGAGSWNFEIPAWLSLGAADRAPATDTVEPAIAVDAADRPVVAFVEDADLVVSRWNGSAWLPLGAALDATGADEVGAPAIAIDPATDSPIVAWIEWDTSPPNAQRILRAAQWSGTAWVPMGGPLNETAADASDPVLVGDAGGGAPMLAWNEGGKIRAARFVSSAWQAANASLPAAASARGTYLTAAGGTTRLVYRASDASIQVMRWSGTAWQNEGGAVSPSGRDDLSITFDENYYVPVVAVAEETDPGVFVLQVRQFDGSAGWYDLSFLPPASSSNATDPRLCNAPIGNGGGVFPEDAELGAAVPPEPAYPSLQLVWNEDGDVRASVFDFFEWAPMGAADFVPAAAAARPSVAHDGSHGVFLAWHEDDAGANTVRIGRMNRR